MSRRADKVVYFTKEDKLEFLNIFSKYRDSYEKNDLSNLNVKTKKEFWKLIEKQYNDVPPKTGPRTGCQLQCLYKNLKRKVRNDAIKDNAPSKTIQDDNTDETQYIILKPSVRSANCVSEAATSTLNQNDSNIIEDEYVVESLVSNVGKSSAKRYIDEQHLLKIKILKHELETKKKEACLNNEICLLRKEIEWKNRETVILAKKAKVEEIQNQRVLMKLQQENEILRNKLLKIELNKARKSSTNNCEDV